MSVEPTPVSQRIASIDVLRGIALLGILVMNIQSFAMPEEAYLNPYAFGDLSSANGWVWRLSHVLAFGKFISIFSMLFGAGIVLRDERGASGASHVRRMAALAVIGLLHAYLLWYGDILFTYALLGMLVYALRNVSPRWLLTIGALCVLLTALISVGLGGLMWMARTFDPTVRQPIADPDSIQAAIDAYRGGWLAQMPERATTAAMGQTVILVLYSLPFVGGLMCVGVALMRLRFFAGAWSKKAYATIALVGCSVGWSLAVISVLLTESLEHHEYHHYLLISSLDYLGQPFAAIGYAAIVIGFIKSPTWLWPVAAVGRMALTCYLLQTLICTTLFYGHGLGWFGSVDRVGQMQVVLCVWTVLLIIAPVWLRFFRFGPAEWLWRKATYWGSSRHAPTMPA